jgi:hypothetical protein
VVFKYRKTKGTFVIIIVNRIIPASHNDAKRFEKSPCFMRGSHLCFRLSARQMCPSSQVENTAVCDRTTLPVWKYKKI